MLESILSVTQVPGDGVTVALEFLVTGKLSQIRKEKFHIIRVTVTFFPGKVEGCRKSVYLGWITVAFWYLTKEPVYLVNLYQRLY